ncbi:MAG: hypothetical protein P8074_19280 [Anaerolineales bacterium]|jgi:hypothetical protein
MRIRIAAALTGGLLFLTIGLAWPVQADQTAIGFTTQTPTQAIFAQPFPSGLKTSRQQNEDGGLTTPELIAQALANKKINQQSALLYLAFAFADYDSLPKEFQSDVPWDGTLLYHNLQSSIQRLPATNAVREATASLLSGYCGSSSTPLPDTFLSNFFYIEYGPIYAGLSIADYAHSLDTAWQTHVQEFGWAAPPLLLSNPPPGNRYHVRIDSLSGGLYGYVANTGEHAGYVGDNPNTYWNDYDAYATCIVLNNNYSSFPSPPQSSLDSTTAHEFHHTIQFGYGALGGSFAPDTVFIEASATWMEDEIFDDSNDNYNYLWPSFNTCMGEYAASPYAYWVTLRGLTEQYGTGLAGGSEQIMQAFWEETSRQSSGNLAALDQALQERGSGLADAFHDYAIAVKFNKGCSGGYVYPYCLQEGPDYVAKKGNPSLNAMISSVGIRYSGRIQDNYALNWVGLPADQGLYTVTLNNTSSTGEFQASIVCDTGSQLVVQSLTTGLGPQNSSTFWGFDSTGCNTVVAVLTNQAQTSDNPSFCNTSNYELRTSAFYKTPTPAPEYTPTPTPGVLPKPTSTPAPPRISISYYFPLVSK